MPNDARAATIEIVERGAKTDDTMAGSVIVPDGVRINGQSLLTSSDHPVVVHEINLQDRSVAYVTLTLLARRIVVGAELDADA